MKRTAVFKLTENDNPYEVAARATQVPGVKAVAISLSITYESDQTTLNKIDHGVFSSTASKQREVTRLEASMKRGSNDF